MERAAGTSFSVHRVAAACCALAISFVMPNTTDAHLPRVDAIRAPYPRSRFITGIRWDFSGARALRKAQGSDIWPCTWAADDALYCAWGDGGGFDGNDDAIGRVSLGFARVIGTPHRGRRASYHGINVWGDPPYAQHRATFGGKVGSLIAVGGAIYGTGSLWTRQNARDPVDTWEAGTLERLIWSTDLGKSWHIAPWVPAEDLGSFLQFGPDRDNAPDGYVYDYFSRPHDPAHVYLKRIAASELANAAERRPRPQYLAYIGRSEGHVSWSTRSRDATAVFADAANAVGPAVVYDPALRRYLLTVGHDPSGRPRDMAPGKLGVFEAPRPWGPWRTVYYGDDWGRFPATTRGDYLGLTFPAKWIEDDGRVLWGVYSGPGRLDAFNLVRVRLEISSTRRSPRRERTPPCRIAPR